MSATKAVGNHSAKIVTQARNPETSMVHQQTLTQVRSGPYWSVAPYPHSKGHPLCRYLR